MMKEDLRLLWKRLKLNPLHVLLGFIIAAVGTILLINDEFFRWPPEWAWFFNNDLVDAIAISIGLGLISFSLAGGTSRFANAILLGLTMFYLMMLFVLQLGHIMIVHDTSRLLSIVFILGNMGLIFYLTGHSKTIKRRRK